MTANNRTDQTLDDRYRYYVQSHVIRFSDEILPVPYFIVPHQSPQITGRMDVKDVKMRTDERREGPPDGGPAVVRRRKYV